MTMHMKKIRDQQKFHGLTNGWIANVSLCILFLFSLWGCNTPSYLPDDINQSRIIHSNYEGKRTETEYILKNGDELEISFYYNPELDTAVVIRPDGFISLQLIGDIKAGGQTTSKVRQAIIDKYSKILRSPEITVAVKNFNDEQIYVGGEVHHPQIVKLGSGKTTLQAIFEAGGFKNTAEMRSVLVLRGLGKPHFRAIKTDLMKLFLSKKLVKNDISLQDNDVVYVPKTLISKVNQFVDQYINKIVPNEVFTDLVRGK